MPNSQDPGLSRRLIRLENSQTTSVYPLSADEHPFPPFPLPPLPLSQSCWLTGLGEFFLGQTQRCLATLMVLNCQSHQWSRPLLPTQRCSPDGASFRLLDRDLITLPQDYRIAGSFQSATVGDPSEAQALVPPFDGLHLMSVIGRQERHKSYFLRIEGQVVSVPPESVLYDDWRSYFEYHQGRLILA